ncbi:MAG: FAD:protein FMN transferase, partial [Phycisphaerales bacterium]|nr:FAD:protein FMN transferase [Phycisphaerales bacterium]
ARVRVVLYAVDEPAAAAAATRAFERIEALDAVMSDYRPDSELSRLSEHPSGEWCPISDDLYRVVSQSRLIAARTDGAFDITIAPVVTLWRQARQSGEVPHPQALHEARQRTGWRAIELDRAGRRVRFTTPGVRLDLGGIGKGFAAAAAVRSLVDAGSPISMVDLGGDLALGSPPPGERGWTIRVSNALAEDRVLTLSNTCVATSGDAEQSVTIGGVRYSHIIDPRTGLALNHRRAATVIHPEGGLADALASAVCVLGPSGVAGIRRAFPDASVHLAAPDDAP